MSIAKSVTECISFFKSRVFNHLPSGIVCCVAGGAITQYLSTGHLDTKSDVDLWFTNYDDACETQHWLAVHGHTLEYDNGKTVMFSVNGMLLQLIKFYNYSSLEQLVESFDFTIVAAAVTHSDLVCHNMFYEDLLAKRLRLIDTKQRYIFATTALKRLQRYVKRGFTADFQCLSELATMIRQCQYEVDPETVDEHYLALLEENRVLIGKS